MFSGEMDYTDINITHWMGYLIFAIFVFLMVIVMMNLLNGLAVSDIHKIQKEVLNAGKVSQIWTNTQVDTYYHVNIIETLAQSRYVPLLAEEIRISPNIKPENQQLCGINIPGEKKYLVRMGMMYFVKSITNRFKQMENTHFTCTRARWKRPKKWLWTDK